MSDETIPLAKGFDASKLEYPAYLSVKHDGVPVRIDAVVDDRGRIEWASRSRSGKPLPSADDVVQSFLATVLEHSRSIRATFVAEITHFEHSDFKTVGGIVRRQEPQTDLILNVFDFTQHEPGMPFARRELLARAIIGTAAPTPERPWQWVTQFRCSSQYMLEAALKHARDNGEQVEGYVARSGTAEFKPGTRHWDYQKIVEDPTVDLRITGFEEAVSASGEPLGMVGRVLADYRGTEIGVGPGKLTHDERTDHWTEWEAGIRHFGIATIKYKRDDTYTALRQPTFQHWRPEKTEPSYE